MQDTEGLSPGGNGICPHCATVIFSRAGNCVCRAVYNQYSIDDFRELMLQYYRRHSRPYKFLLKVFVGTVQLDTLGHTTRVMVTVTRTHPSADL
jgi:hypothetical protein